MRPEAIPGLHRSTGTTSIKQTNWSGYRAQIAHAHGPPIATCTHAWRDMACIVGGLGADHSSREVERTLWRTGIVSPSRAFLEKARQ